MRILGSNGLKKRRDLGIKASPDGYAEKRNFLCLGQGE